MAKEKLSQRIETQLIENGFLHIILPDGFGGYNSYKVSPEVLRDLYKDRYAAQTANFTVVLDADTALEGIDFFYVSGSINVKVGTSLAAKDIISTRTIDMTNQSERVFLSKYFASSTTLYFTLTGTGSIDVIINYKKNYNS